MKLMIKSKKKRIDKKFPKIIKELLFKRYKFNWYIEERN